MSNLHDRGSKIFFKKNYYNHFDQNKQVLVKTNVMVRLYKYLFFNLRLISTCSSCPQMQHGYLHPSGEPSPCSQVLSHRWVSHTGNNFPVASYSLHHQLMPSSWHALFMPYLAQGHVLPLLELEHRFADHSFVVTFVDTEHIHGQLIALRPELVEQEMKL